MNIMLKCKICGKKAEPMYLCKQHFACEVCGAKENLCIRDKGVICDQCHAIKARRQVEKFDGDTDMTDEVTCPWCGHEEMDSWEFSDEGEKDCGFCGNEYSFLREITVTYATEKLKKEK
jgi:hypothetical protein